MSRSSASPSWVVTGVWLALLAVAVGGVSVVLLFVVPGHKKTFDEFGLQLPWLTTAVVRLSSAFAAFGLLLVPALALAFGGVPVLLRHVARLPRLGSAFAAAELALLVVLGVGCFLAMKSPLDALTTGLSK